MSNGSSIATVFRSLRTRLEARLYFGAEPSGASSSAHPSPSSDCKTRWRCGAPADQRRSWRRLGAHFYHRRGPRRASVSSDNP